MLIYKDDFFEKELCAIKSIFHKDLLRKAKKCNVFIAGGAILSIFGKREINDYDLFFQNIESFQSFDSFIKDHFNCYSISDTSNAITYDIGSRRTEQKKQYNYIDPLVDPNINWVDWSCVDRLHPFQLIKKQFGTPIEILNNFDITLCMCGYQFGNVNGGWYFDDYFFKNLQHKKIKFNEKINIPFKTISRAIKYQNKGFKCSMSEWMRLLTACNTIELRSIEDWENNLIGLYSNYMENIFDKLRNIGVDFNKPIVGHDLLKLLKDNNIPFG